jgi:hypothetical protein
MSCIGAEWHTMYSKQIKYRCACGKVAWAFNIIPKCPICGKVICDACEADLFCASCAKKLTFQERKEYYNAREDSETGSNGSFACPGILIVIASFIFLYAFLARNYGFIIVAVLVIVLAIIAGLYFSRMGKKGHVRQSRWKSEVFPRVRAELGLPDPDDIFSRLPIAKKPHVQSRSPPASNSRRVDLQRCPRCGGMLVPSSKISNKTGQPMKKCPRCRTFY